MKDTFPTAFDRSTMIKLTFWGLVFLLILPVWLLDYLPLVDLPLHAARTDILHRYSSDSFLRQVYDLVIEPIPNVGTDLLMMWMRSIFSVSVTVKLIVSLIVLLYVTGIRQVFLLFRPEQRWLVCFAPLLTYHTMFLYGFFNYCFGLGLFFWTFSFWLRRSEQRFGLIDWLVLVGLAAVCYFTHLSSYAMLGVAIAAILGYDLLANTSFFVRRFRLATAALIPLIFFVLFIRGSGTNSGTAFSDLYGKLTTLLMMVTTYDHRFDAALIIALIGISILALVLAKSRSVEPQSLVLTVSFAICFAVCPATLFTSTLADARLVPVVFVFLLCAFRFKLSLQTGRSLVFLTLALLAIRSGYIVYEWVGMSQHMTELQRIAEVLPARSKVRTLCYYEDVVLDKRERPFRHALAYKMIDRDAVISDFIALRGQQPVVFKEQPDPSLLEKRVPLTNRGLDTLTTGYQYVWAYKLTTHDDSLLSSRYRTIARAGGVSVYQL